MIIRRFWCSYCGGPLASGSVVACPHCGVGLRGVAESDEEGYRHSLQRFAQWKREKRRERVHAAAITAWETVATPVEAVAYALAGLASTPVLIAILVLLGYGLYRVADSNLAVAYAHERSVAIGVVIAGATGLTILSLWKYGELELESCAALSRAMLGVDYACRSPSRVRRIVDRLARTLPCFRPFWGLADVVYAALVGGSPPAVPRGRAQDGRSAAENPERKREDRVAALSDEFLERMRELIRRQELADPTRRGRLGPGGTLSEGLTSQSSELAKLLEAEEGQRRARREGLLSEPVIELRKPDSDAWLGSGSRLRELGIAGTESVPEQEVRVWSGLTVVWAAAAVGCFLLAVV